MSISYFQTQCRELLVEAGKLRARVIYLEAALRVIASYDPGQFRPLEDEIAIHKIATTALLGPKPRKVAP